MSMLSAAQWSTLWSRKTITTLESLFPENYDLNIAEFWQQLLVDDCQKIVDLACGNGALSWLVSEYLEKTSAKAQVIGLDAASIDPFTTLDKDPEAYPMVKFLGDVPMEDLPFDSSSIDIAVSQYGLEYANLPQAIAEIARVLKPRSKMGFIVHNKESTVVKGSTQFLQEHKIILNEIRIHELFLQLDQLIGKNREFRKISGKPKIKKQMIAINAASDRIQKIIAVVSPESEIQRYCIPMFNAFSEVSINKGVNRKGVVQASIDGLADYINRIEDLQAAALSDNDIAGLVNLIEKEGFKVTENRVIGYKKSSNIGTALVATR